ncbi:hypothetical protein C7S14_1832 [Burkholderia cepacia]|nr:hypothetical protein C7S14_1832 [Burkholderia cepacia]
MPAPIPCHGFLRRYHGPFSMNGCVLRSGKCSQRKLAGLPCQ